MRMARGDAGLSRLPVDGMSPAFVGAYHRGLHSDLDSFIGLFIHLDALLRERWQPTIPCMVLHAPDHGLCQSCSDTGHLPKLTTTMGNRGNMTSHSPPARGGLSTETNPSQPPIPGVSVSPAVFSTHPFVIPMTLRAVSPPFQP